MKGKLKAFFCTMLALIMALSCTSVAFAKNDVTPVVCIHGMGAIGLYKDVGTENEAPVEGFSIASLFTIYNDLLKKIVAATDGRFNDAGNLIDEMAVLMQDMTEIACDENGNSIENVTIKDFWNDSLANHIDYLNCRDTNEPAIAKQICDKIGAENVFAFNYDWRFDAYENAGRLSAFIDNVKSQTGKSKVTIVSGSEGTVVASAYIDRFMSKNDIEKTVFVNGAFYGVGVCKLFNKDIIINKDVVLNYLWDITHSYVTDDFDLKKISWLSYTLSDAVDNLCLLLNQIVDSPDLLKRFYNEVLYPVFGCIPILWEFIPYDDFNSAVSNMSSIGFLDKNSGLYNKIMRYHGIQGRLESNLKALRAKGVEVAIITNYGMPGIPATSDYKNDCDALIDTKYSSVGATVADFGKTLSSDGKYVSADKVIDASTCVLPNNTWFIKGIDHMGFKYGSEVLDFIATLAVTSVPLNIDSIKKETGRDQFMGTDRNQNIVSVTQTGSSAGSLNITTTTEKAEKKSPMTGSNDLAAAAWIAFVLTALSMTNVLKRRAGKVQPN